MLNCPVPFELERFQKKLRNVQCFLAIYCWTFPTFTWRNEYPPRPQFTPHSLSAKTFKSSIELQLVSSECCVKVETVLHLLYYQYSCFSKMSICYPCTYIIIISFSTRRLCQMNCIYWYAWSVIIKLQVWIRNSLIVISIYISREPCISHTIQ